MRTFTTLTILGAAALAAVPAFAESEKSAGGHTHGIHAAATANVSKIAATNAALRDLWLGHVFWVRNVVTASFAGDQAATSVAEGQVVANAKAIAGSIEPFYGVAAKDQLFGLLAAHYGAVKAYLDATLAKDAAKQSASTDTLLSNAKEIAVFLSGANPNLPQDAVESLLQAHGGHHIAQIQQLQAKDFAAEAKTWADMTQHMYVIADALGVAIAKQFPDKFASK